MGIVHRSRFADADWLTKGPIAPHVDLFKQHLADGRYASSTVATYLSNIAHFGQWLRAKRLRLSRIDEGSIAEFLDHHLPHCRCVGPIRHDRCAHRAALGHLLFVLRARGLVALPTMATPVDEGYGAMTHMKRVRGWRWALVPAHHRPVGASASRHRAVDMLRSCRCMRRFTPATKLYRPADTSSVVTALRGYFRYRASLRRSRSWPDRRRVQSASATRRCPGTAARSRAVGENLWVNGRSMRRLRSCAVPWISAFAAAKLHGSISTTSTGEPARSFCATPRACARTCCRCQSLPGRPSPRT